MICLCRNNLMQDHLALMMELLGKMPRKVTYIQSPQSPFKLKILIPLRYVFCTFELNQVAIGGGRSKDYFDRHGDLKRIRRLKHSSLSRLLIDKFKVPETDANEFANFLNPILDFAPEKRPTAQQCLQHPWLRQPAAKTVP